MGKNYYEILGVSQNATKEEIRAKYIELVKKYHPDINTDEDATNKAQEINVAYDILSDEVKRKEYDKTLNNQNNSNETDTTNDTSKKQEEPFNYEEEINKYTEREKKYAEKLATEKVIKDELLKVESIVKAKLEVLELSRQENMIEEYYEDKVFEFWDISDNYITNLENLIELATINNLNHLITEINEKINIVTECQQSMPLTMIDAQEYLENKESEERVSTKITEDINKVKSYFNIKNNLYDQILAGFITKENYDRYREIKLYELQEILNNTANIKKLAELYSLDKKIESFKEIDELIEKAEKSINKLPRSFDQAKKKAEKYYYYNEKDRLINEVENLMHKFRQMKSKMATRVGAIITLKEMEAVSAEYKLLLAKYSSLHSKQKKLKIEEEYSLKKQARIERLSSAYDELWDLREEHLNEFFNVFTDSINKHTVGGLLSHENRVFSGICLLNATAATLSVATKHYLSPAIPSTIILTSINAIDLKKKYEIYKHNYNEGKKIINSDVDTKEEYKEYCLRRNIKNKSI